MTLKNIPDMQQIDPKLMRGDSPFRNHLLIAMPGMDEGFFSRSVVYICAHSDAGAMGIVINQKLPDIEFHDLLKQLGLPQSHQLMQPVIHFGGPVEAGRGFVLHTADFLRGDTVRINDSMCLTGTTDILRAISEGRGPQRSIFALGYSGWGPGQLEAEMQANSWLTVPADDELVFDTALGRKWDMALHRLGIAPATLSMEAGHA
ncbi:MAG: YqgE/AlgH family protein [Micavibrio sp.]|nr:YqgE/AlgH family protein [Micavibrio sp.]